MPFSCISATLAGSAPAAASFQGRFRHGGVIMVALGRTCVNANAVLNLLPFEEAAHGNTEATDRLFE